MFCSTQLITNVLWYNYILFTRKLNERLLILLILSVLIPGGLLVVSIANIILWLPSWRLVIVVGLIICVVGIISTISAILYIIYRPEWPMWQLRGDRDCAPHVWLSTLQNIRGWVQTWTHFVWSKHILQPHMMQYVRSKISKDRYTSLTLGP